MQVLGPVQGNLGMEGAGQLHNVHYVKQAVIIVSRRPGFGILSVLNIAGNPFNF